MDLAICFPDVATVGVSSSPMGSEQHRVPTAAWSRHRAWRRVAARGAEPLRAATQITEARSSASPQVRDPSRISGGVEPPTGRGTAPLRIAAPGEPGPGVAMQITEARVLPRRRVGIASTSTAAWNHFHAASWRGLPPLRVASSRCAAPCSARQITEATYPRRRESFTEASRRHRCRHASMLRPASHRPAMLLYSILFSDQQFTEARVLPRRWTGTSPEPSAAWKPLLGTTMQSLSQRCDALPCGSAQITEAGSSRRRSGISPGSTAARCRYAAELRKACHRTALPRGADHRGEVPSSPPGWERSYLGGGVEPLCTRPCEAARGLASPRESGRLHAPQRTGPSGHADLGSPISGARWSPRRSDP